jgi:hypothetical protein
MNILITEINIWASVLAGVVGFTFGAMWYSQALFAKPWMRGIGLTEDDMKIKMKHMKSVFALSLLNFILIAFSLSVMLAIIDIIDWRMALTVILFVATAFVVTSKFSDLLYSYKGVHTSTDAQKLFLIEAGFAVCNYTLMGMIVYFLA